MASITTALSSYPVALTTSNNEKAGPLRPRLFVIILFPLFNFTSPRVTRRSPGQNRGLRFWGQPHAENQMQKLMNETFFLIGFEVFCRASIPRLPQQNHGRSPAKFADRMRIPIGRISSFPAERTLKFRCPAREFRSPNDKGQCITWPFKRSPRILRYTVSITKERNAFMIHSIT